MTKLTQQGMEKAKEILLQKYSHLRAYQLIAWYAEIEKDLSRFKEKTGRKFVEIELKNGDKTNFVFLDDDYCHDDLDYAELSAFKT